MTGVVGPGFVLLHSAGRLDNWVSLGFWSMILTVASGLVGRYLSTEIPERASTAAMEILEEDRQLLVLRAQHDGVRVVDGWLEAYRRRLTGWERLARRRGEVSPWGSMRTLWWVLRDDLGGWSRRAGLARSLRRAVAGQGAPAIRDAALRAARRLAVLERRRTLLPLLSPLFSHWKAVHIPMAVALTLIGGLHILMALRG